MNNQHQIQIFQAMARPEFYPHDVSTVEQRDTHISKVFLTGEYAYKIKKPVYLEFLDFTTLEKRRHYCQQEVTLNQRLSNRIYLEVVPITRKRNRYCLAGSGEAVEYAVKMRQLPEKSSMLQLVRRGKLEDNSVAELARTLAKFYKHASTGCNINNLGTWSTMWTNTEENFSQTEQFAGNLLDEHMFQIIRAATRSFLIRRKALFDRRVERGKIRDCHGDLRAGHIYFCEGIQIIDCIEFNDRFRYADITSDLAFLTMDLDFEGCSQLARHLINYFLYYTGDEEMLVLLDFYKCYRAYVRAKVNCFCLQESDVATSKRNKLLRETQRYLNLSYRYAVQFTRPTVWVVCGLPASGKTTMAKMIAKILSLGLIGSDVVRKKLFGMPLHESQDLPFEEGMYSKESTALVYGKLLMMAQEEIQKGRSIILDATFSTSHQRNEALRLARDMDADIIFVECLASNETLKKRLSIRNSSATISDARLHHFKQFKDRFEPISELADEMHICIDTEKPLEEGMRQILSHDYALLTNQTERAIKHWESSSLNVTDPP
jgi:aminoglycoside phosphotransferase family enzyme/predicted kinase